MKIRSILFPVFNWGQAFILIIVILLLIVIAFYGDPMLALHMGVGAYFGIVIYTWLSGLAPDETEISEDEIGPIVTLLAKERLICPVGDQVWAPIRAKSWLFKSDRISINEIEAGRFVLKARKRDLKFILSEIREGRAAGNSGLP